MKNKVLKFLGLIKLFIYKIRGFKVSFNHTVFFHPKSQIIGSKKFKIIFKNSSRIAKNCQIKIGESSEIVINEKANILENVYIEVGKNANLSVGKETFINRDCKIVCMDSIKIGEHCAFGSNILMYDHDHIVTTDGRQNWDLSKTAPIIIGDETWVCSNVMILRGATVGHHCVIGAATIIKGTVPDKCICHNKISLEIKEIKEK